MNRNKRGTPGGGEQHGYHCFAYAYSAGNVGNGEPACAEFADTLTLSPIRFAALYHRSIPKNLLSIRNPLSLDTFFRASKCPLLRKPSAGLRQRRRDP